MIRVFLNVVLVAALSLFAAACNTKGLLEEGESFQITKVEVRSPAPKPATVNLPEDLRYKTLQQAYKFSETGTRKTLKVNIEKLHIKNPVLSVLVGDNNHMVATAELIDVATGRSEGTVKAVVVDNGAVQGIAGALQAAFDNPVDVEQRLASSLAPKILEQLYGSAYASSVRKRASNKVATPRYPTSYAQLKRDRECELKRGLKERERNTGEDIGHRTVTIPAYCNA